MKANNKSKIVFGLSILTAVFWCLVQFVDVYHFAVSGALFEMLWLPMIASLFILPVFSLVFLVKEKFSPKSLYLYSLLVILAAAVVLFLRN